MPFDPSTAQLFDPTPEKKTQGFDPTSATLVEDRTVGDAIKEAVGWKSGLAFTRPEGVTEDTFSAGMPGSGIDPTAREIPAPRYAVPEMTAGSVARDIGSGLLQLGPTALKGGADILRLATGDRLGKDTSEAMDEGIKSIQELVGSERGQAQRKNFEADMANDDVSAGEAMMRNKGALADQLLPTLGSMFLPVGAAGAAGKLATVGKAVQGLDKAAIAARVASAQTAAGVGAIAAQNAADTFSTLLERGASMEDAYLGAGITVPFSVIAGKLTGGGAELALTRALTGTGAIKRGITEIGKGAFREGSQEVGEEAGQITGEAVGLGETPSATNVSKRLAVAGTLGAVLGGGVDGAASIPAFETAQGRLGRELNDLVEGSDFVPLEMPGGQGGFAATGLVGADGRINWGAPAPVTDTLAGMPIDRIPDAQLETARANAERRNDPALAKIEAELARRQQAQAAPITPPTTDQGAAPINQDNLLAGAEQYGTAGQDQGRSAQPGAEAGAADIGGGLADPGAADRGAAGGTASGVPGGSVSGNGQAGATGQPSGQSNVGVANDQAISLAISEITRPNGAIGTQGVSETQVRDILAHVAGMQIPAGATMRDMVTALQNDKAAQQRLRDFTAAHPLQASQLPDGTIQIHDGHHRAFLLNQIGDKTIPAQVNDYTGPSMPAAKQQPNVTQQTAPGTGLSQTTVPAQNVTFGGLTNEASQAAPLIKQPFTIVPAQSLPESVDGTGRRVSRNDAEAAQLVLGLSGATAEFVEFGRDAPRQFDGVTLGNRVLVSTQTGKLFGVTVAHEVGHVAENTGNEAWAGFEQVVLEEAKIDLRTDDGLLAYARRYAPQIFNDKTIGKLTATRALDKLLPELGSNYNREFLRKEFAKDVFGNAVMSDGFMGRVARKLARTDMPLLKNIVSALTKAINVLRSKGGKFATGDMIKNLERVRDEAAKVMAEQVRVQNKTNAELKLMVKTNPAMAEAAQGELDMRFSPAKNVAVAVGKSAKDAARKDARLGTAISASFKPGDNYGTVGYPAKGGNLTRLHERMLEVTRSAEFDRMLASIGLRPFGEQTTIRGMWLGKPEWTQLMRLKQLNGEPATFEQTRAVANLLAWAAQQDAAITSRVVETPEDGAYNIPSLYFGKSNGEAMSADEIDTALKAFSAVASGASATADGKAIKFLFFPNSKSKLSEADQYKAFGQALANVATSVGLDPNPAYAYTISALDEFNKRTNENEGRGYRGRLEAAWGKAAKGLGPRAVQEGIGRRAVDTVLVPYIAALRAEGFAFDFDIWQQRNGASEREVTELRAKVEAYEAQKKHGLVPKLRETIDISGLPNVPIEAKIGLKTTSGNADRYLAVLDGLKTQFPNAVESAENWLEMEAHAFGSNDVPVAPRNLINLMQNNGAGLLVQLRRLTPGQVKDANSGFDNAAEFLKYYTSGQVPIETTGKLMLWSFLSRGVSPYIQEAMFVDAVRGVEPFIKMAAAGQFGPAQLEQFIEWSDSVAQANGAGAPGNATKHNLNAFGKSFLTGMSERLPNGKTKLQHLHDLMADKKQSGRDIRREFVKMGEGVGIDNKVISFTLLVTGRPDVLVLDRIQMRNLFDDGSFAGYNLYDGTRVTKLVTDAKNDNRQIHETLKQGDAEDDASFDERVEIATAALAKKLGIAFSKIKAERTLEPGTGLASATTGVRGLMLYEFFEDKLQKILPGVYQKLGRPQDATPGRYHWESWVVVSGQEASHGTLDSLLYEVEGKANPFADVTVKQGEYGQKDYGVRYGRDTSGNPYYLYPASTGELYRLNHQAWRDTLKGIDKIKAKIPGFLLSKDADGRPRVAPWFEDSRIDRTKIDDLLKKNGTANYSPSRDTGGDRAVQQRREDAAGAVRREAPGYGRPREKAVSVRGVHYSTQSRAALSSGYFGTGVKSEEALRLTRQNDLRQRLYFYVDEGQGLFPEQGVGDHAHDVNLNNLYNLKTDPVGYRKLATSNGELDANKMERLIMQGGFDGWYAPEGMGRQGVAVLLGSHGFAPRYLGTGYRGGEAQAPAQSKPDQETDADRVEKARVLPMGEMKGSDWKRMIPAVVPGADVSMLADGKAYYKSDVVGAMRGAEVRLSPARLTETPEFKAWSGGSPLVLLGEKHKFRSGHAVTVEVLHGTTNSNLTEFLKNRANIESDWGAGFYFSNTPEDVATNYANNEGPDLTRRVEQLAEQIANDDEFDGDMNAAMAMARRRLSEDAPNTLKLYVRFNNPAVLGGQGETFFDYSESYNEDTDEYGEPTGLLVDFVNSLDEAGSGLDVSMRDLEDTKAKLFEAAEGDGIKLGDLSRIVKEGMVDTYSEDGNSSGSSEILRQALEGVGFDGIIDTTVVKKFGPRMIKGGYSPIKVDGMSGMTSDTVHFIAFEPTQIKSAIGNNGQFDPTNPDIRYSPARATIEEIEGRIAKIKASDNQRGLEMVEKNLDNIKRGLAGEVVRDEQGNLLAPNGRKSNLTEQQYMQVRTPEFKAWFGDWLAAHNAKNGNGVFQLGMDVSKVVDENGEPLIVYHGAEKGGFTKLLPEKGDKHRSPMIFAAKTRETARSYSGLGQEIQMETDPTTQVDFEALGYEFNAEDDGTYELVDPNGYPVKYGIDLNEAIRLAGDDFAEHADEYSARAEQRGVYSLYLNIRNPNEFDFEGQNWDGTIIGDKYEVFDGTGDQVYGPKGKRFLDLDEAEQLAAEYDGEYRQAGDLFETTNTIAEEAIQNGQDGAILRNVVDDGGRGGFVDADNVYVIFDSHQAKSATQNTGAFSKVDNDLRYSPARFEPTGNQNYLRDLKTALTQLTSSDPKVRSRGSAFYFKVMDVPPVLRNIVAKDGSKPFKKSEQGLWGSGSSVASKATNTHAVSEHGKAIDPSVVTNLPKLVADPIAVFSSEGGMNRSSYRVVLDRAVVAIEPQGKRSFIMTIHPLSANSVVKWANDGLLHYINEKAATKAAQLEALPVGQFHKFPQVDWSLAKQKAADNLRQVMTREDVESLPVAALSPARATPTLPAETKVEQAQRIGQDKFNRFGTLKEWAEANGLKLSEQADVYRAEERYHGRVATRLEDFREKTLKPLIEKIHKAGFTMQDVAAFLEAQHTPEANAHIRKLTNDPKATAAGVTDADAAAYLAQANPALKRVANEFRQITEQSKRLLLRSGLISQEQADAWSGAYQHYVPLKGGPEETAARTGQGPGMSVNAKQKRRLGHGKRAEFVIENIIRDHERAILLAEKNLVGQHLLQAAIELQQLDPDLITIGKPEKRKVYVPGKTTYAIDYNGSTVAAFDSENEARRFLTFMGKSGMAIRKITGDPHIQMTAAPMLQENEAGVYVQGQLVRIQLNDPILARAYKNLGVENMNAVLRGARHLNTWLSKAYTGLNPEFILVNMARDFTGGLVNITGNYGAGIATSAIANYPKAMMEILAHSMRGKTSTNVQQYRDNGGSTGGAYLSDLERVGQDVEAHYNQAVGVMENLGNRKVWNASRAASRKTFKFFTKWIEHMNAASENAMRLAVFMAVRDKTGSLAEAASAAKNSTVNFNRVGEAGRQAGALYLFANPNIQGTAALWKALVHGEHKGQAWALVAAMTALAMLASLQFDDDEWKKIPEFEKDRNLLIRLGDKRIKIPVPYGYGFFFGLGNVYRNIKAGDSLGKVSAHLASAMFEHFSPFGNPTQSWTTMLPTAIKIPVQHAANTGDFGRQIVPENQFNENKPDFLKMNRSTKGTAFDAISRGLNDISGGTAGTSGLIDISPETTKTLWRTMTGGTGAFWTDLYGYGKLVYEGAERDMHEVPVLRKFASEPRISDVRANYFEETDKAKKILDQFNAAKKERDLDGMDKLKAEKEVMALAKAAEASRASIKAMRDKQDSILNDTTKPLAYRRAEVKQLERKEAELYQRILKAYGR